MAISIELDWARPTPLEDGTSRNMEYWVDWSKLPTAPGVYVFARRFGAAFEPLYIGQATNIASRVKGQLNNLKLMKGILNAPSGGRYLLYAIVKPRRGVVVSKGLDVAEKTLIENALTDGHRILNKQGTRFKAHEISCIGSPKGRGSFKKYMYLRIGKSK